MIYWTDRSCAAGSHVPFWQELPIARTLNILFTCAGRRVALMKEFRRALEALGLRGRMLAADVSYASAAFHAADAGVLVPPTGTIEYVPALCEIVRAHDVGLIVPVTDLDLRSLARQERRFADLGCQVMIGTPEAILLCRDKTRTARFLAGIGLPAIRTLTLEQFQAEPFYPCFIKPVRGSASLGTGVLHSPNELRAHLATYGDLMFVQDYITGAEYTLDIYRTRAGRVAAVVPRQRLAIRSGEVEKGLAVRDEELIAAGVFLGERLEGIWGVVNAQCRRPAGGRPHFFEINPRFGGGATLAIAAGADLPRYVLEEVLDLPVSAQLGTFQDNLLMLRYDEAVYVPVQDPAALPGYDSPNSR